MAKKILRNWRQRGLVWLSGHAMMQLKLMDSSSYRAGYTIEHLGKMTGPCWPTYEDLYCQNSVYLFLDMVLKSSPDL